MGIFSKWFDQRTKQQSDFHMQPFNEETKEKMKLLKAYLANATDETFYDILADSGLAPVMWIDWREEDDAIIGYCENIIQTGQLHAFVNDTDDKLGFEIIIEYKGQPHKIHYAGEGADRDTTIMTLNEVLKPDFEIRFCMHSNGGDTLAFLPLAVPLWEVLEQEFGHTHVRRYFKPLSEKSKLFN